MLEIGKEADISILDRNPLLDISHVGTVSAVMTNGNYYEANLFGALLTLGPAISDPGPVSRSWRNRRNSC